MLEFTLLLALVVFVIAVNRWLKTTAEEQHKLNNERNKKNIVILIPVVIGLFAACDNTANDRNDRDSLRVDKTETEYEPYMTQEDFESIRDEMPDSVGKVFSRAEYEGMRLFMANCNKCHPGGEKGEGPSLIDKPLPDFLIHFQVRQGLGDMPSFTKEELPKEDVRKIVLFIKALREDYDDFQNDPNY